VTIHAAVLGDPVAHSLSPLLHTAAYAALGLTDHRYHALRTAPADLPALFGRVRAAGRWCGLSLTMPLKAAAVPLLDDLATDLGVVNTVVVTGGRLVGHNTDVDGVRAGLAALGYAGGPVAVLGAGGTARAALAALRPGTVVSLHVRSPERAAAARALGERLGLAVTVGGLERVPAGATVVSTLPPTAPAVPTGGPLLDVAYAPWPTPTAAAAHRAGQPVVGGLTVLVGQAAGQVRLMTGLEAPVAAMESALPDGSSSGLGVPNP
jgi:shikimate dehydrogenase